MKIIDFPVIILAAGLGKRFGGSFNGLNKTLLHIDDEHTILDNILYNIIDVGVTKIIIITGYNSDKIIEYCENLKISYQNKPILNKISKKFLNTKIEVIKARDDYKKGPLYTFLTINRYIFEGSKKIDNIFSEEQDFFVVIPADTILNRKILEKILNYQIVIDTKKMKNNKSEDIFQINHAFTTKERYKSSELNQELHSSILPILFVSKKFILSGESFIKKGYTKISDSLNDLNKNGLLKVHFIKYKDKTPAFYDIDTKEDLMKLREIVFNK